MNPTLTENEILALRYIFTRTEQGRIALFTLLKITGYFKSCPPYEKPEIIVANAHRRSVMQDIMKLLGINELDDIILKELRKGLTQKQENQEE